MAQSERPADLMIEMYSQPRLLTALRAATNHLAQRVGFAEGSAGKISLAVDEAVCNVINHGYARAPDGRIAVRIWADEMGSPSLRIVIEDDARQVDPSQIRSRNLDDVRPGGLGVHIIREVMDQVVYEKRPEGGMRLTMTKSADAPTDAADGNASEGCKGEACS